MGSGADQSVKFTTLKRIHLEKLMNILWISFPKTTPKLPAFKTPQHCKGPPMLSTRRGAAIYISPSSAPTGVCVLNSKGPHEAHNRGAMGLGNP